MNNEFLIKMLDGGLINVREDCEKKWDGCETCDYGSKYVSNIDIYLSKYEIYAELGDMYCPPSVGDLLKIFIKVELIQTMTELEFVEYFKNAIEQFYDERSLCYEPEIKVINKEV